MFTADAHCDTLFEIAVEHTKPNECKVTAASLSAGHVALQTYALFAGMRDRHPAPAENAMAMLAALDQAGVPFYTGALPDLPPESPAGILSIEGAEILGGSLERFQYYRRRGVRMIAITWNYENEAGYPAMSGAQHGLKPFGLTLLRAMDESGVLADVSHLNEAGFDDIAAHARLPFVASHSNLRKLCDVPRNLTDAQARAIIASHGYIGINFYAGFLATDRAATLDDVVRHIDAIMELGGEDCVGFGSDFDGIDAWPDGLAGPADIPALLERLARHGYTDTQLRKIAGLNYWRVLKAAEGTEDA